jgi:hypothetical protein
MTYTSNEVLGTKLAKLLGDRAVGGGGGSALSEGVLLRDGLVGEELVVVKVLGEELGQATLSTTHENDLVSAGVLGVLDELDVSEALEGLEVGGGEDLGNDGVVGLWRASA